MESWDPTAFKTLLRTTSQRLGQLQERKDSQCQFTRRDIATHLFCGQLGLARAKAAVLIQEDVMGDLIEELEMMVGVLASHAGELAAGRPAVGLGLLEEVNVNGAGDNSEMGKRVSCMSKLPRLSPVMVEAAASIIHAAPTTESKDLNSVREILIQRLGPAFAQTASATRNNYVSPRVMHILSSPPPTASKMDEYLLEIADTYDVKWAPEPRREQLIRVISEILRVDVGSSPIVDLPRLREICARGLPDNPPWIRPRVWRLLFGTLPVLKTTWAKEAQKQRASYYDLVQRLLSPLASLPPPTNPLSPTDALLSRVSESLFHVSPELFALLGNEPKSASQGKCPLDLTAPDTIRIVCASSLDKRLVLLKGDEDTSETPEIRLESDINSSPDPTSPQLSTTMALFPQRQRRPTTLLPSKPYNAPPAHRAHLSALLRLLYIHSSLNPVVQSPHVPWLLVPLYSALVGEINEDDVAHVEADTFWVFEALVGEIAEMEEENGGKVWMRKLSERIRWADGGLATSLHATGLDPALPHYSYRWLAPLLSQALPLSSIFPVWDALFARPIRTRDVNPKLEHLVDVCTALLIRARTPLFRLGKPARNVPGLWSRDHMALPPVSPLRPWELSDAFTEGIALLTSYPIDAAGGIDRILQTASDLAQKRIEDGEKEKERERENVGLGARITQRMWRGFTNQVADANPEEEEEGEEEEEEEEDDQVEDDQLGQHDDGNETETPAVPTLTSRIATTVWRGITNQSSMDDEVPSPPSPLSEEHSPSPTEEQHDERLPSDPARSAQSSQASLWEYAGKLKHSDTVAAFSKVSTNWRARALEAWRVRKESNAPTPSIPIAPIQSPPSPSSSSEIITRRSGWPGLDDTYVQSHRRGSLPGTPREGESATQDPPRPTFFRSPRESFLPQPRRQQTTTSLSPNDHSSPRDSDTESSSSFIHRAGASLASLASFQSSQSTPKSVPRPLMLSSRDLIATKSAPPQFHSPARSEGSTPEYRVGTAPWGDVLLANKNRHTLRHESVSSASSLAPSEAMTRSPYPFGQARSAGTGPRSDYESDESTSAPSRRVPLNRKSVSPMALASRSPRLPWNAPLPSPGARSPGHPLSNGSVIAEETTASGRACPGATGPRTMGFDSPTTIGSPPIPRTPVMSVVIDPGVVRIVNGEHVAGTSSISTLSEVSAGEANMVPLEPPTQGRHLVRKKTPPPAPTTVSLDPDRNSAMEWEAVSESEASEASLDRTPSGKAPVRIRTKRYKPRPGSLHLRPAGTGVSEQRRAPSPRQRSLTPEWVGEYELAATPKMESSGRMLYEDDASSGVLTSPRPSIARKLSKEARVRKISTGSREPRRTRESGAEEGDDEGYDELLSAYESEEGSHE